MCHRFRGDEMKILAIDPGNIESAFVVYNHGDMDMPLDAFGKKPNKEVMQIVNETSQYDTVEHLAIEMVACYGMLVGETVFETALWVGRYIQEWTRHGATYTKVYRKQKNKGEGINSVVMEICKTSTAKDSNVRQAIIDRYPATGGGATPQIGIKSQPGPLYGVSKDVWAALAVAITYCESVSRGAI